MTSMIEIVDIGPSLRPAAARSHDRLARVPRTVTTRHTGKDAYGELGVRRGADDGEILAAYRHLARRFHPDLAGEVATRRMSRINAAFGRIRDAGARSAYDAELTGAGITIPGRDDAGTAGTSGHGGRDAPTRRYRWTEERDGTGGAGPPPGRPSGSVLSFGRHIDWSIGEIARVDPGYLAWLEDRHEGRPYLEEIDRTLRRVGYRAEPEPAPAKAAERTRGRRRWSR